jgi:hypothetical protein
MTSALKGRWPVTHSFRMLRLSLLTLLAVGLSAHSAVAQDTVNAPALPSQPSSSVEPGPAPSASPAPDRVVKDTDQDHDRLCRHDWLAVGRCWNRKWTGPELMFGADLGFSKMNESGPFGFSNGVGGVTDPGPAWGLRLGVELFSWFAVEARYVGMSDSAQSSVSPTGSVGYVTTGAEAVLRFTAPFPFVHPYVFGGVGYYDTTLMGSSGAKAGSPLNGSTEAGFPLGFGLDVPLNWHLSLGAEATYHYLYQEKFSAVTTNGIDGGDLTSFSAVMRVRL